MSLYSERGLVARDDRRLAGAVCGLDARPGGKSSVRARAIRPAATRDPRPATRHPRGAGVHKARKLPPRRRPRDISVSQTLMSRRSATARHFRAFCTAPTAPTRRRRCPWHALSGVYTSECGCALPLQKWPNRAPSPSPGDMSIDRMLMSPKSAAASRVWHVLHGRRVRGHRARHDLTRSRISRDDPPDRSIRSEPPPLSDPARRPRPRHPPVPGGQRRAGRCRRLLPGDVARGAARLPEAPRRLEPQELDLHGRITQGDRSRPRQAPATGARRRRARAGRRRRGRIGHGRAGGGIRADDGLWSRVRALPPKQRTALALRYVADAGYDEIATVMDTSEDAARRNVHEALKRLRTEYRT